MDDKKKGIIFDIQRYSLHDGPGIRTLIFMKGCPLRCIWCSNPESQKTTIEIGYMKKNCTACGKCVAICRQKAINPDTFDIDRNVCIACGMCAEVCAVHAKKRIGSEMTVEEVLEQIERDRLFYRNSGGGVTIGGGEPTGQPIFVRELLKKCKDRHIHTCIETCGYASKEIFDSVIEYVDTIIFDLKQMNSNKHKQYTGVENQLIFENAKRVGNQKEIIFRIPYIPGINDDDQNLNETFAFAATIKNAIRVEILPYHNLGEKKYNWIGNNYKLSELKPMNSEQKDMVRKKMEKTNTPIEVKVI